MKSVNAPERIVPDVVSARLNIECMEEQKESLRALISVLQGLLDRPDTAPDVRTLLNIAAQTCEDHQHWYGLREALGIGDNDA